jgi:homoserine kinase type II
MAVYTVLDHKDLNSVAAEYGLGRLIKGEGVSAGSVNTHYLLETARGRFFLKIDEVKGEPEVKREIDLLLFLHRHRFPCPQPISDKKGRFLHQLGGKCLSLHRYVAGKTLTPPELSLAQLRNVGRVLANLHVVGKGYKKVIENRFSFERVTELYGGVREQLPAYLKKVVRTLDEELDYLRRYLQEDLPKGIIHGDLFADNLIFRGERIAGVLDFEAAGRGKFIFDLATAVNALCYKDNRFVLEAFAALMSGYESVHPFSLAEWDAFPNELRFSALRFTVTRLKDFFLNPMDNERRENKDFRDFFERLQVLRREREGGMEGLLMAMATGYDYRKYQKVKALEKSTE